MGRERVTTLFEGPEATEDFAARLGATLTPNTLIALYGDLGAGKTTFVRGLVRGLGGEETMVESPTFIYVRCYPTLLPIFHFDLYRMKTRDDFTAMGFEEVFDKGGIVAIEWPERIESLLPPDCLRVYLSVISPTCRRISLE
jgi:tRNA threonylcarbamoyladenosine biosynthesis protein TsaE